MTYRRSIWRRRYSIGVWIGRGGVVE